MLKKLLILLLLLTALGPAQTTPEETANKLYTWLKKVGEKSSQHLAEAEGYLTPELYSQLTRAYAKDPNQGDFLDFDPWSNTQMGASGYTCGKAKLVGAQAKVPITVAVLGGGTQKYTCILERSGDSWRVANLVYAPDFNLLSVLKDLNKTP